jgi:4'-phosphopantetheinyl transferase
MLPAARAGAGPAHRPLPSCRLGGAMGREPAATATAGAGKRALAEVLRSQVHVWLAEPEQLRDAELVARYQAALSREERARAERLRGEPLRHAFAVARALLRGSLSRYCDVAPEQWSFAAQAYGRPYVAGPAHAPPLRFNLSHTRGLIACAVTRDVEVGCDVEDLERRTEPLPLAERYFAPREVAELKGLAPEPQRARFLEYWTLKEAYLKARGLGLRVPLERFVFELPAQGPIRAHFEAGLDERPERWQFALLRPTRSHVLALAAERPAAVEQLEIRVRSCVPLRVA